MDETFQLRARRMLGPRQPAALDYELLTAGLLAQQQASPAARAQALFDRARGAGPAGELLIEAVLGGPHWQEAAAAQLFCFNRAEVKRRAKAP